MMIATASGARRRRRGRSTHDPLDAAHAPGAYDPQRLVIVVRVSVRVHAHHVAQERGIRIPPSSSPPSPPPSPSPSPSSRRGKRRRGRRRRGRRRRRPRGGRRRRRHARRTPAMTTALVGGLRVTRQRRRRHDGGGSRLVDGWEGRQRRAPRGGGFRRCRLLLRAGRHGSGFGGVGPSGTCWITSSCCILCFVSEAEGNNMSTTNL